MTDLCKCGHRAGHHRDRIGPCSAPVQRNSWAGDWCNCSGYEANPAPADPRDAVIAALAEHDRLRSHGPSTGWFCRGCGQKMTDWPQPEDCRPHESAMEVVLRAHVADQLMPLLAQAWDDGAVWAGAIELDGVVSTVNPYRTENTA